MSKMSESKKIRYGVIGLGHIAQVAVLPAFRKARRNSVLAALITGDAQKAEKVSKQYKVPMVYHYDQFEDLLASNVIDALYIALPNHLHTDYAVRALRAGIHVLCEKPLALTIADGEKIAHAAERSGCKAMTAYRLHFEASNLRAREYCQSGKLGKLRYFSSDFSFQIQDPDNIRLQQETGGGPVWDIGIYCINAVRMVFDAQPEEVFAYAATAKSDHRFHQVEEMVSVVMRFPNSCLATFNCSYGADTASIFQIYGSEGSVCVQKAYEYASQRKLIFTQDTVRRVHRYKKCDQFAPEITYFSDCILNNTQPEPSIREGIADIEVILAIYESIARGKPIRVADIRSESEPSDTMRRFVEPHADPKMINVTGPSN